MAQVRVNPGCNQAVRGVFRALHHVVEVRPCSDHGCRADGLARDDEERAGAQEGATEGRGEPAALGEEEVCDEAFDDGSGVGDVIGGAVLRQEEGRDICGAGVVLCGGPDLEEVEDAEDADEEWRAPERGGLLDEGVESQGE